MYILLPSVALEMLQTDLFHSTGSSLSLFPGNIPELESVEAKNMNNPDMFLSDIIPTLVFYLMTPT